MNDKLIKAVIKQLGYDSVEDEELKSYLQDVVSIGASGGFNGFVYHSDTIAFFRKNKKLIVEFTENFANDIGEDVIDMVKNFNCLKGFELKNSQIGKILYARFSDNGDNVDIMNALSWFALEEVAKYITEKNLD